MRRVIVLAALLVAAMTWSGSALAAPTNTQLPEISGRAEIGAMLFASTGVWSGSPSYTYQWQQCGPGRSCLDIPGATNPTYVVRVADGAAALQVVVTATDAGGSTKATSATTIITTYTVSTPHFLVHYQTLNGAATTEAQAGDVAALAERAYAAELADGYPAPLSDGALGGDGRVDIYIAPIDIPGVLAYAVPDGLAAQSSGYIVLNGSLPTFAFTQHTVAHELFHLIQFGLWLPPSVSDDWLFEASAEWMAYRADGFAVDTLDVGDWDMALDCLDPLGGVKCDLADGYKQGGYSRWPFFEYVAERWGAGFTRDVLARGPSSGSAVAALSGAVAAKGSSLADVFTDWTVANLTGGYALDALHVLPPAYGQPVSTGSLSSLNARNPKGAPPITTASIPATTVPVNHLSARYVALRRGDAGLPDAPCFAATLSLSVALPPGVGARPYFWWSQKKADGTNAQAAQPLAIDGNTASITVPWDTCDWSGTQAYVALPNPSTTLDAQDFRITGTISIDRHTEATATPPPDPVSVHGATVDAAGAEVPQIEVYGPQLLRVAPGSSALRLIVSSSGSGELQAALGSVSLGSARIRAGSNDVRFRLPASFRSAARRTSAAAALLTLTPRSSSGAAGKQVVRRVAVDRPAAKKKHAPKKKHAAPAHRRR